MSQLCCVFNNGVHKMLNEECGLKDVTLFCCDCHSADCCKSFFQWHWSLYWYLVRETYNWFSMSPKRREAYNQLWRETLTDWSVCHMMAFHLTSGFTDFGSVGGAEIAFKCHQIQWLDQVCEQLGAESNGTYWCTKKVSKLIHQSQTIPRLPFWVSRAPHCPREWEQCPKAVWGPHHLPHHQVEGETAKCNFYVWGKLSCMVKAYKLSATSLMLYYDHIRFLSHSSPTTSGYSPIPELFLPKYWFIKQTNHDVLVPLATS